GGVLWGAGVTLLGSWLGNVGFVNKHIELILILIVLVSVIPIAIEFLRARSKAGNAPPAEPARQQPPVMDDATTRLRRIEPDQQYDPYQQEQQGWNQGYDDQYYDQQRHGQQQHPQQYEQQQYDQQHPQQYEQQQYDQQQYPHQYDQQQYPQDYNQGNYRQ
ncbi:hypothetical protein ACWC21_35385, partial [Streptomyces sp. NPDC001348]